MPVVKNSKASESASKRRLIGLVHSVWFFPLILTIALLVATVLRINGSSLGEYYSYFNGGLKNPNLLLDIPRPIRSDEFVVNTQMTIAQKNDNFARINKNIGNGEDMSMVIDAPYKDWSELFKPHNLVFFVLPFDNAFAFKWWVMGYLLVLSCYFFILALLPKKKFLAVTISLALLFSPFVQWWYQYITLGPIYYSLFIATAVIYLLRAKGKLRSWLWGLLIAYLTVCFALVLYPPFQIACALAVGAFLVGYILEQLYSFPVKELLKKIVILVAAGFVAGIVVLAFFETRLGTFHAIEDTSYPGQRLSVSGGYSFTQLMSGNLDYQLQFVSKSVKYQIPTFGLTNQSEDSNFLPIIPFLVIPSGYLIYKYYKKRNRVDWPLLLTMLCFILFLSWMFIPGLSIIGKLTFLNRVPLNRLLIGVGVLDVLALVLVIRRLSALGKDALGNLSTIWIFIYAAVVLVFELLFNFHVKNEFPGFLGIYRATAFALPIPIIIYALLKKYYRTACLVFLACSFIMSVGVNPLYRGTAILTDNRLSIAIRSIASHDKGRWATELGSFENFPEMNGAPSLTGVYVYPQLSLWSTIDNGKNESVYNRYAHTNVTLNRSLTNTVATSIALSGADHFGVTTDPCGSFLRQDKVKFILTDVPLPQSCVQLIKTVPYPEETFLIYELN
jgi:hypothetical protein